MYGFGTVPAITFVEHQVGGFSDAREMLCYGEPMTQCRRHQAAVIYASPVFSGKGIRPCLLTCTIFIKMEDDTMEKFNHFSKRNGVEE
jgi:hypothetical protein